MAAGILTYKVVLVGESGVGKDSYVKSLRGAIFPEAHVATLGVEVHSVKVKTNHPNIPQIHFQMWSTAGDPRFRGLCDGYYIAANAFLVMYDLTQPDKANLGFWMNKIGPHAQKEGVVTLVLGNKKELVEDDSMVDGDTDYLISAKMDGDELLLPLQDMARRLTGIENLELQEFV